MDTYTLYRSTEGRVSSNGGQGGTRLNVRAFTPKQAYFLAANGHVFDGRVGILLDSAPTPAAPASKAVGDPLLDTLARIEQQLEAIREALGA